jgi:hypothetical protein
MDNYVFLTLDRIIKEIVLISWHDVWKPEQRSQSRRSLLGNDSVNRFPQKWTLM